MNKEYPYSGAKVHFIFKVARKLISLFYIFSLPSPISHLLAFVLKKFRNFLIYKF